MTEFATLRWGDVQAFSTQGFSGAQLSTSLTQTKQLVAAVWEVPLSWNVILVAQPSINAGDNGTFSVSWLFTLGAGQTTMGEIPLFTMGPFTKTATALTQQQQLVPSQSLQIRGQISVVGASAVTSTITLGAFVAPNNTEPFAERNFERTLMRALTGVDEQSGSMRFMPMGFHYEDPLHYKPR
jgi:hypothetical protein